MIEAIAELIETDLRGLFPDAQVLDAVTEDAETEAYCLQVGMGPHWVLVRFDDSLDRLRVTESLTPEGIVVELASPGYREALRAAIENRLRLAATRTEQAANREKRRARQGRVLVSNLVTMETRWVRTSKS